MVQIIKNRNDNTRSSKDRPLAVAWLSSKTFLCRANSTGELSTMIGRLWSVGCPSTLVADEKTHITQRL